MTNYSALAKAEDEAIEWAILLADDPDSVDQQKCFQAWLDADSLHAEVWARTLRVYEGLGQLPPVAQDQWPKGVPIRRQNNISGAVPNGLGGWVRRLLRHIPVSLFNWRRSLAGLAIAVSFMLVFVPHLTLRLSADYLSGTGEQQTHILEDGTKLYLAPRSAVDISYTDGERQVHLLRGSAFFEVQPNANRPFHVDAGGTRTTVLGTSFNVHKSDSGVSISVAHGHVRVEDRSISPVVAQNLTEGDQLLVSWGKGAALSRVVPGNVASWRKGELVVRNLSVREVAEAFHDYYDGLILVREPFASQRVTGLYRLNNPVTTLTEMALAHGAKAHQITPWLLVLGQ
jgi:transmembrane sensor